MTVKELIEKLQMYDGSMPVYFMEECDYIEIGAVKVKKMRKCRFLSGLSFAESAIDGKPFFCGAILEGAEDD